MKSGFYFGLILAVLVSCGGNTTEGDRYFARGQYQKAIEVYNEYLDTNPTHVKSIYNRGRSFEELGQLERATEDFNRILEIQPGSQSALLSLANISLKKEDPANAVYYAGQVIENSEDNALAFFLRGRGHHKQGNLQEALSDYNNAIAINKSLGQAFLYRGAVKIALRQTRGACSDLRIAKSLNVAEADNAIRKYCN